jgi:hypothetical protein
MIKIISGRHLTPTNKRVISEMLRSGMTEGQSGRIVYRIADKGDNYSVEITQVEKNDYGKPVNRVSRVEFSFTA